MITLARPEAPGLARALKAGARVQALPRHLHFIWWQGADLMPARYRPVVEAWRQMHPGWQVTVWDARRLDAHLRALPGNTAQLTSGVMQHLAFDIQRVDLARLLILCLVGGVYSDLDILPLRSIEGLLGRSSFYICREPEPFLSFCNAFIGACPGHPVVVSMLAAVIARCHLPRPPDSHPNLWVLETTGPRILSPVVASYRQDAPPGTFIDDDAGHIYPQPWSRDTLPMSAQLWSSRYPESFAVHLWDKSWHV